MQNPRPIGQKFRRLPVIILFAATALFIVGIIHLFLLRFHTGDSYPPYSSLRADPLGAMVFYESLKNLPLLVKRNFNPLSRMEPAPNIILFYLGAHGYESDFGNESSMNMLNRLILGGVRMVITFSPTDDALPEEDSKQYSEIHSPNLLKTHWGISFSRSKRPKENSSELAAERMINADVPDSISWHRFVHFDNLHRAWKVVYSRDGYPVLIERPFGKGSLVLAADSYFLSNESLRDERHPRLLAWLLSDKSQIVFDEYHFGIQHTEGIVDLGRKYRLHWLLFSIVIVAGLLVWKNASPFPPLKDEVKHLSQSSEIQSAPDHLEGFVSLLRRNIPSTDILNVCAEEWKRSVLKQNVLKQNMTSELDQMLTTLTQAGIDPVTAYRRIDRFLSQNRRH